MSSSTTARLGREVVAYTLSPSSAKSQSTSHAAIVNLHHLNASSPIAHLRGTTPIPSSSSLTLASDGDSTLVLHADTSRPLIHVHEHQSGSGSSTSSLAARLHPPEVSSTLALSPSGTLLAAGSASGRIYIWYLPSGNLVASLDAHFRAVTCLEWTSCETGLVSASQDARILVWSVAALVDESNSNVTPYAIFADHVQPVTSIKLSSSPRSCISTFPSTTRLLSASVDGTVKLWDMRSRALVATWTFQGPINHLSVETGFRAFFVALRARLDVEVDKFEGADAEEEDSKLQESDMVRRIDLYGSSSEDTISSSSSLNRGKGKLIWRPKDSTTRITAMTLSTSASHLLIGTSEAHLHVIDVASSLMIRSASLVPTGNLAAHLNVSGLQTFLYQDGNSPLAGSMRKAGNSLGNWDVCEKLQRTRDDEAPFAMRLPRGRAAEIAMQLTPPSLAKNTRQSHQASTNGSAKAKEDLQAAQRRIATLEADNEKLNDLLRRAQKTNAGLWEKVVKETMS